MGPKVAAKAKAKSKSSASGSDNKAPESKKKGKRQVQGDEWYEDWGNYPVNAAEDWVPSKKTKKDNTGTKDKDESAQSWYGTSPQAKRKGKKGVADSSAKGAYDGKGKGGKQQQQQKGFKGSKGKGDQNFKGPGKGFVSQQPSQYNQW